MFTIYGIRLHGDTEVRYVGQTGCSLDERRRTHLAAARSGYKIGPFVEWLIKNEAELEFVDLDCALTCEDALAKERLAIQFCCRLNHRLFNRKQSGAPVATWAEEAA